jgi:hypothetical protein
MVVSYARDGAEIELAPNMVASPSVPIDGTIDRDHQTGFRRFMNWSAKKGISADKMGSESNP